MNGRSFGKIWIFFLVCFFPAMITVNLANAQNGLLPPIHQAVIKGNLPAVKEMLDIDQDVNSRAGVYEITPLHVAAQIGTYEMVRILIRRGASLDSRDIGGCTPLHYAARSGRPEIVDLLVKSGADTRIRSVSGFTPLHFVIHTAPDWDAPASPLRGASSSGWARYPETARVLLENGASLEIENVGGKTPYSLANWNRFGIRRKVWKVIEEFHGKRKPS